MAKTSPDKRFFTYDQLETACGNMSLRTEQHKSDIELLYKEVRFLRIKGSSQDTQIADVKAENKALRKDISKLKYARDEA